MSLIFYYSDSDSDQVTASLGTVKAGLTNEVGSSPDLDIRNRRPTFPQNISLHIISY